MYHHCLKKNKLKKIKVTFMIIFSNLIYKNESTAIHERKSLEETKIKDQLKFNPIPVENRESFAPFLNFNYSHLI